MSKIFGGGGGIMGTATSIGGSALPGLLGGASAIAGTTLPGILAASGGSVAAGGLSMAKLGAFMTNPWTIGIGAAALGAFALWRLFRESPEDKMKKKIKELYGVSILDKGLLRQFVGIAQSAFGGNISMAAHSTQIRDLVQMYADATGQSSRGMRALMSPSTLMQSGGGLYQQASYSNGVQAPYSGGLPGMGLNGIGLTGASNGATVINITVPGAKQFFESETVRVIAQNGKVVSSSAISASKSNYNRREMTALQLAPGTVTN